MTAQIRTVETRNPCPLCAGTRAVTLCTTDGKTRRPLHTAACSTCALVRVDPLPGADALAQYYRDAYRSDYKGTLTPKLKHVWRAAHAALDRMDWVAPLLAQARQPMRRVLDIGSGGGEWVALLARRGWQAHGLEPNRGYGEFSRRAYGIEVTVGTLWDTPPAEIFDAVTSFHVLEHLHDPVQGLRRMADWLAPGGRLIVEVPNVLYPHAAPGNTFFRAHLFHFSAETLIACGVAAGLVPLWQTPTRNASAVRVAFERRDASKRPPAPIRADEAQAALAEFARVNANRTWPRYLLGPEARAKLAGRLRRIVREARLGGRFDSPAELVEALYRPPTPAARGRAPTPPSAQLE